MDLAHVSFGQYGLILFLRIKHLKGNLLTFWYLHDPKLMLTVNIPSLLVLAPQHTGGTLAYQLAEECGTHSQPHYNPM